jgi:hypothetical protein
VNAVLCSDGQVGQESHLGTRIVDKGFDHTQGP